MYDHIETWTLAVCYLVLLNHITDRSIVGTTMNGWRVELDRVWLVRYRLSVLIIVDFDLCRCSVHSQSMLANNIFFLQHTPSIVSAFPFQLHLVHICLVQSLCPSRLPSSIPHRSPTPPVLPGHRQQRTPMAPFTYPTLPFHGIGYVQQKVGRVFNT